VNDRRFLIVAFDGLRPDAVSDASMPNLARFCREGVHFSDCRAVFPSETRVNQASLVTGCQPARHGVVANKFVEPAVGGYINTADFAQLSAADAALDGGLLTAESLGEVLRRAGGALAVLGSGTPGGNRILHHRAESFGHLNMSLHGIDKSTTPGAAEALRLVVGDFPPEEIPNARRMDWLVEAYIRLVAPRRDPTVTIIWFSDPDRPYHYRGIDHADSLAALRHADAAFGRLLSWREASGLAGRLQVAALSDHGHVATVGRPLDLAGRLGAAGFALGRGGDAVLVPGSCGSLYAADAERQRALTAWLQAQPWCGPLFARAMDDGGTPEGTLPLAACGLDHARAGDLVFVLGRDDAPHRGGSPGRCLHDNPEIPEGCGMHGGLSRYELSNLLAFSGSCFASARRVDTPAGIVDVMPTMLHLLDLETAPAMDGRVLHEALAGDAIQATRHNAEAVSASGYRQALIVDEVAGVRYLREGRRVDAPPLNSALR
jgi:phosphonoacetate hydrolase